MEPADTPPPARKQGGILHMTWRWIPRLILAGMVLSIFLLMDDIQARKSELENQKASEVGREVSLVNVVVLPLSPMDITDAISLPGVVEPWHRVTLKSQVQGMVKKIPAQEGDAVQKGDVLVEIDPDDYRIALERARAAHALATAEYERDRAVYKKGFLPEAQLDITKTNVALAKADLNNAALMLGRCTIKAPISGVIRRMDAEPGLLLSVGDPIAQILDLDPVKAVIGIPESDIPAARKLSHVPVTIKALKNRRMEGLTHFISPAPDSTARLYPMELALDNPEGDILPGMFVRARVIRQQVKNAVAIPFYSIITRNDEQFVFVEKKGIAQKRKVKLGIMEKWMVQIIEGLSPGDHLVVEGHRDISDGQEIQVVRTLTDPEAFQL